jgi:hypothetical protein
MKRIAWILPLALMACGAPPQGHGFKPYAETYAPNPTARSDYGMGSLPAAGQASLSPAEEKALKSRRPVVTKANGVTTYTFFTKGFRKNGTPLSFSQAANSAPTIGGKKAHKKNVPVVANGNSYGVRRVTLDGYRFAVAAESAGNDFRDVTAELAPAIASRTGCRPTGRGVRQTAAYGEAGTYVMEIDC